MALKQLQDKVHSFVNKYKYVALVLIVGLVLMLLPIGDSQESVAIPNESPVTPSGISLEDKLADLLSKVEGAGEVEVILTVASGEEVIYQLDENRSVADNSTNEDLHTVTVTDSQRNQNGLIKQVNPETYKGAIILCHGANDPTVRLAIVEAISRITGLGANCISILKMK